MEMPPMGIIKTLTKPVMLIILGIFEFAIIRQYWLDLQCNISLSYLIYDTKILIQVFLYLLYD
jgi:hypothetical protein